MFNQKRPPKELGEQEITEFLTYLAVKRHVTSSTQNFAFCAIVFMYKHVFERELPLLPDLPTRQNPPSIFWRSLFQRTFEFANWQFSQVMPSGFLRAGIRMFKNAYQFRGINAERNHTHSYFYAMRR